MPYQLGNALKKHSFKIATAESCTGGEIAQAMAEVSGSSLWFDRGFVTYSNQTKVQMLSVKQSTLERYGAVSEQVIVVREGNANPLVFKSKLSVVVKHYILIGMENK